MADASRSIESILAALGKSPSRLLTYILYPTLFYHSIHSIFHSEQFPGKYKSLIV